MNGVNKVLSNGELDGKSNSTQIVYEFDIPIKMNSDNDIERFKQYDLDSDKRINELLCTMLLRCEYGPEFRKDVKRRSGGIDLARYAIIMPNKTIATVLSIDADNMAIHIVTRDPAIIQYHNDIFAYPRAFRRKGKMTKLITFDLYPNIYEPARGC